MKIIYVTIIAVLLIISSIIIAQTRRTKDEEFIQAVMNIEETQTLVRMIRVCDPDGDPVSIVIEGLPEGATLSEVYPLEVIPEPNDDPNCVECFTMTTTKWYGVDLTWTPTYEQSGEYKLYVHAVDDNEGEDWVVYIINVINKNRPPIL